MGADIQKIAKLARIEIDDAEVAEFSAKLQTLLSHFENLAQVNTEGVAPMFHAMTQMHARPDAPEEPLDRDALLRNAPENFEHSFRLPKVLGRGE